MKLFRFFKRRFQLFVHHHTKRIVDQNDEHFRLYPRWSIWLVLYLSYNVLAQGVADVVLKIGGYTPYMVALPWRTDYLFLTAISVLMGYQALKGMRRRELDVTRNSVSLGILVESALVIGDLEYIWMHMETYPSLYLVRLPFLILTSFNILILTYIALKLRLFVTRSGKFVLS